MEIREIGDILELQRGYDLPVEQMAGGEVPVVGSNGIVGYHNEKRSISPTVTVGRSGSIGKVHYYEGETWVHNTALYVSNFKNNNPLYIYYLLKKLNFENLKSSSVVPSLNRNFVYPMKVPFATNLSEQESISNVLYSIDQKIALNTRMNAELEAMAKQLYDYWFVQFDFPDENGNPYKSSGGKMVYNPTLKREIPAGWEDCILSDIANITMGQSPDGSSYNEKGEGSIFYQGSTDFGIRFPSVRMFTTAPTRFAKKGDILMSVRAPVGDTNIANSDCCIGRGLSAINSKLGSISHLFFIIRDLKTKFDIVNAAGTTFGAITKEELYNLPIVKPDNKVLDKYEMMCSPIFEKQMNLGFEIEHLTHLRDSLLPMLMNGQVTVE